MGGFPKTRSTDAIREVKSGHRRVCRLIHAVISGTTRFAIPSSLIGRFAVIWSQFVQRCPPHPQHLVDRLQEVRYKALMAKRA